VVIKGLMAQGEYCLYLILLDSQDECSYLIPPGLQGKCSYLISPDPFATYNKQAGSITQNESLYLILSD
ncbi:3877_t:CDS:2, partial [Cetraspora pellucida]